MRLASVLLLALLAVPAAAPAVYRGAAADPGATPWFVSFTARGGVTCGGALVSSTRVVTAAHCVTGRRPSSLRMRLGGGSLGSTRVLPEAVTLSFPPSYREILPRPDSPPQEAATVDDLAVVRLSRPVADVPPLRIAGASPADGEVTVTYGRGLTRSPARTDRRSPTSDLLLVATQVVVGAGECARAFGRLHDAARHLCTIDRPGRSKSCAGDSGGPVVVVRDGEPLLAGVVTWGDETQGAGCAGVGLPDVSERALIHLDWLRMARLPAAPWAHRRVRVRVAGDRARCVIGRWGGGRARFGVRWYRPGEIDVRDGEVVQGPDRFIPGATGTTLSRRRGPVHCEVTATSLGGVAIEQSYNGAWAPRGIP